MFLTGAVDFPFYLLLSFCGCQSSQTGRMCTVTVPPGARGGGTGGGRDPAALPAYNERERRNAPRVPVIAQHGRLAPGAAFGCEWF